jgi:hypothetical protein
MTDRRGKGLGKREQTVDFGACHGHGGAGVDDHLAGIVGEVDEGVVDVLQCGIVHGWRRLRCGQSENSSTSRSGLGPTHVDIHPSPGIGTHLSTLQHPMPMSQKNATDFLPKF